MKLKIGNETFTKEELFAALGIDPKDNPKVMLQQEISSGTLSCIAEDVGGYPALEIELDIEDKNTNPIMVTRVEQPEEGLDNYSSVRCYNYWRNDEYFAHFDVDERTDPVVDADYIPPKLFVSGSPFAKTEVVTEDRFVSFTR